MLTKQRSTARVLLVNDDSFELATMAASLRLHSVNVVGEAPSKFLAENLFRSLAPEVVLIDLQFAGEEALALVNKFRKISIFPID
jgi:chemotaxis response regulator CheB